MRHTMLWATLLEPLLKVAIRLTDQEKEKRKEKARQARAFSPEAGGAMGLDFSGGCRSELRGDRLERAISVGPENLD
jgi:hypothetical protein